jgi:hypothetical protein
MQPAHWRGVFLVLAAAFNYLVWRGVGPLSVALCAPLYAYLLARPLLDLLAGAYQLTRAMALRKISGRHFEHHGISIDIVEDEDHYRWLRVADVRKIVLGLPDDRSLLRRHPEGAQRGGKPAVVRIKAETLAEFLKTTADPASLRFRNWLEKEVSLPARQVRERNAAPTTPPASGGSA